jgi:hypothetical protein
MKWIKVVEVHGIDELSDLLNKEYGGEWHLHSWQAGTDDRLLVVFERQHE